jgi:integrase
MATEGTMDLIDKRTLDAIIENPKVKNQMRRDILAGHFPAPVKIAGRSYWVEAEVKSWLHADRAMHREGRHKVTLKDRGLMALKPAAPGKRYMVWDTVVPSFGVRVTDRGHVTFIVMRRLPGSGKLLRVALGDYPAVSLAEARELARTAVAEIMQGRRPGEREEARRREAEKSARASFTLVAEAFIRRHVAKLRSRKAVEADIRRRLMPRWKDRPIDTITKSEITRFIREVVDDSGPYAAYKLLAYTSKLFNWAIARDEWGLEHSPCDRLKPADLIGKKMVRQRILGDLELRLFWQTTQALSYPFGPLFQFLLLTGQRRTEASEMTWPEVNLDQRLWVIPAERMKSGAPHLVPLANASVALLAELPRFAASGRYVFSTTGGRRPVSGFSKPKERLDTTMQRLAGTEEKLLPWRLHDLRRTARTHFSALPSTDLVRELAISHTRPGLHRVYDQFAYVEEKRALFEAWAQRLIGIVTRPTLHDVVPERGEW